MVIKVYTSGISGNKEVKKRQQRILMILESKNIKYEVVDITEPGNEEEKQFMQENAEAKGLRNPLPPQIFNESEYCGDYDGFDLSNENDELEEFLKLPIPSRVNGEPTNKIPEETVHGYCFTPSLAQRLTKTIAESYLISMEKYQSLQPVKHKQLNEDEEMEEEMEEKNDKVQELIKKQLYEDEEMEEEEEEILVQESDSVKDVTDSELNESEMMVEGEE